MQCCRSSIRTSGLLSRGYRASCGRRTWVCATPLHPRSARLSTLRLRLLIGQLRQMTLSFVCQAVQVRDPAAVSEPAAHLSQLQDLLSPPLYSYYQLQSCHLHLDSAVNPAFQRAPCITVAAGLLLIDAHPRSAGLGLGQTSADCYCEHVRIGWATHPRLDLSTTSTPRPQPQVPSDETNVRL